MNFENPLSIYVIGILNELFGTVCISNKLIGSSPFYSAAKVKNGVDFIEEISDSLKQELAPEVWINVRERYSKIEIDERARKQ